MENLTQKKPIQFEIEIGKSENINLKRLKAVLETMSKIDIGNNELKVKIFWNYVNFVKNPKNGEISIE